MALNSFSESDQKEVRRTVGTLLASSDDLRGPHLRRLATDEPLYIMRVPPNIRVIFQETAGRIVVLDIVRKDTLQSFAGHKIVRMGSGRRKRKLSRRSDRDRREIR